MNLASIAHFYQQQRQTRVHPDLEPAPSGGSTLRIWDRFGKNLGRIRSFDTSRSRMFAVDRLWVEADVVDLCPPRPARIKDYNEHSRRAGHRRDAQRTRTGESLHRWAVSTLIPADPHPEDQRLTFIYGLFIRSRRGRWKAPTTRSKLWP